MLQYATEGWFIMYHQLTPSQENYLEHIINRSSQGRIRVRDLAESVGVKLPSVTRAVQKLVEAGMVRHKTYGKIEITDIGKNTAKSITRRDVCLNRFLGEVLGLPPEQAKSEACRIEHVISDDVITRLEILVDRLSQSPQWNKTIEEEIDLLGKNGDRIKSVEVGKTKPHT